MIEDVAQRDSGAVPPSRASRALSLWKANPPVRLAVKLAVAVIVFGSIAYALGGQWQNVRRVARDTPIEWRWVAAASAITLTTFAALVQSWRLLLAGWDRAPGFWRSTAIWTTSNLARFVPGTLWSVGALGVLAQRERISPGAAAGAAILGTLLNLGAGMGIMVVGGSAAFQGRSAGFRAVAIALAAVFVAGVVILPALLPPLARWLALRLGRAPIDRRLSSRIIWTSTAINVASWIGYGAALWVFARGVAPQVHASLWQFVVAYAAAYLAGYVFLFLPGGIGMRELALANILTAMGASTFAEATFLAFAHRIWITTLDVLPGVVALAAGGRRERTADADPTLTV